MNVTRVAEIAIPPPFVRVNYDDFAVNEWMSTNVRAVKNIEILKSKVKPYYI